MILLLFYYHIYIFFIHINNSGLTGGWVWYEKKKYIYIICKCMMRREDFRENKSQAIVDLPSLHNLFWVGLVVGYIVINGLINFRCQECPVVKPNFLCGIDNRTYSSPCRLDYHNCIHHTSVHIACIGFCPCKGKIIYKYRIKKKDDTHCRRWWYKKRISKKYKLIVWFYKYTKKSREKYFFLEF